MLLGMNINKMLEGPMNDLYKTLPISDFDYVELAFYDIAMMSDEDFEKALKLHKEIGMPTIRANGLIDPRFTYIGEDITPEADFKAYLEKAYSRGKEMGVELTVWGSGKTRSIPETGDRAKHEQQLIKTGQLICDTASRYGMQMVIEPLNRTETNVATTVKNAVEFIKTLDRPNMGVLADSYHMRAESEPFSSLKNYMDLLRHAHIAEAKEGSTEYRRFPDENDEFNTRDFIRELKNIGYDACVTVECGGRGGDFVEEALNAGKTIKKWMKE